MRFFSHKADTPDFSQLNNPFGFGYGANKAPTAQGALPPPPPAPSPMTLATEHDPGAWGVAGFRSGRGEIMTYPRILNQHLNPATGQPFQSYQEWAQYYMPDIFAGSRLGRGEISQSEIPPVPQFQQQQAFQPPPMPDPDHQQDVARILAGER